MCDRNNVQLDDSQTQMYVDGYLSTTRSSIQNVSIGVVVSSQKKVDGSFELVEKTIEITFNGTSGAFHAMRMLDDAKRIFVEVNGWEGKSSNNKVATQELVRRVGDALRNKVVQARVQSASANGGSRCGLLIQLDPSAIANKRTRVFVARAIAELSQRGAIAASVEFPM